jgi:hypothetical protein
LRQRSQSHCAVHFAAKSEFLPAFEPRQFDAEMQHNRPTNVVRRQHIFREKAPPRSHAEVIWSTVHSQAPAQTPPSVHTAFTAGLSRCSLPEQWDTLFATICVKSFGVAKLVVTIQVEHDAHLCSLQKRSGGRLFA